MACTTCSNIGIALNSDLACSTAIRMFRQSTNDSKSSHRSCLTTAIDATSYLGCALNGDIRVTTHQCRVTMCHKTGTSTKYITCNSGGIISISYRHFGIIFHAAYLAAAIDVTFHRSGADDDIRCIYDGFLAPPCFGTTSAGSKHIAMFSLIRRIVNTYRTTRNSNRANTCVGIGASDTIIASSICSTAISLLPEIIISQFTFIIFICLVNDTHIA